MSLNQVQDLINKGNSQLREGKYGPALISFKQALKIAEENNDFEGKMESLGFIGDIEYIQGKDDNALEHFNAALKISKEIEDNDGKMNNLIRIGYLFLGRGDKEASGNFEAALTISNATTNIQGQINCLGGLGEICFMGNHFDKALNYSNKALEFAKKNKDCLSLFSNLQRIGCCYLETGKYEEALKVFNYLNNIEKIESIGRMNILRNIGKTKFCQRKNKEAIEYFTKALEISKKIGNTTEEMMISICIGRVQFSEGKNEKALKLFKKALEYFEKNAPKNVYSIFISLEHIGRVHLMNKDYKEALEYFEKALKIAQKIEYPLGEANILSFIGVVFSVENGENALGFFEKALKIAQKIKDPLGEINNLIRIGRIYLKQKKFDDALKKFLVVLKLANNKKDLVNRINASKFIGDIYLEQKEFEKALKFFEEALKIARGQRKNQMDLEGRLFWNKHILQIYEKAIEACLELSRIAESTEEKEGWERRSLLFTGECKGIEISQQMASHFLSGAKLLPQKWDDLKSELKSAGKPFPDEFQNKPNDPEPKSSKIRNYSTLIDSSTIQASSESFERPYAGRLDQELDEKEFLNYLDEDTVVLSLTMLGDSKRILSFLYAKINGKITLLRTPEAIDFPKDLITELMEVNNKDEHFGMCSLLAKLDRAFEIETVLECIKEKMGEMGKELSEISLIVEPDEELHKIPFHLLYDESNYLFERVRCVSVSVGIRTFHQKPPKFKEDKDKLRCVFFGVPGIFCKNGKGEFKVENQLNFVSTEAEKLKTLLGEENIAIFGPGNNDKFKPTKSNLQLYHSLGNILVLSSHGEKNGAAVYLMYGKITPEDFFEEREWDFTRMHTVVLSCCFLGNYKDYSGKEMLGMISSLYSKGASSVVSALWEVNDEVASKLIPLFVKHLKTNLENDISHPRSMAIKSAMIDFKEENNDYESPYFWGPFFMSGIP